MGGNICPTRRTYKIGGSACPTRKKLKKIRIN